MAKTFVLKALRILGSEEILKLSTAIQVRPAQLKKAAGEELIAWSDSTEHETPRTSVSAENDENVLPFKRTTFRPAEMEAPLPDPAEANGKKVQDHSKLLSSDFLLWQREMTKESSAPLKKDVVKGYSRSTEMYVVKSPSVDGKEKIRFASTNGVLVNKKQA